MHDDSSCLPSSDVSAHERAAQGLDLPALGIKLVCEINVIDEVKGSWNANLTAFLRWVVSDEEVLLLPSAVLPRVG